MKKENLKNLLLQSVAGAVCMVVLGVILLTRPDFGSAAVGLVFGWGLIIAGGIGLLVSILSWPVMGLGTVSVSVFGLLCGMYLVRNPLSLASILGTALGIYLIFQGLGYLNEGRKLKSIGAGHQASMVLGTVMLVFGIVLLAAPLAASQLVMSIVGILLILCGGASLLVRARSAKRLSAGKAKTKPKIIDADE